MIVTDKDIHRARHDQSIEVGFLQPGLRIDVWNSANTSWYCSADYYRSGLWRGTWEHEGGVLINQAIHAIDLLRWLTGTSDRVAAQTQTLIELTFNCNRLAAPIGFVPLHERSTSDRRMIFDPVRRRCHAAGRSHKY